LCCLTGGTLEGSDYMVLNVIGVSILVVWIVSDVFIIVRGLIHPDQEEEA